MKNRLYWFLMLLVAFWGFYWIYYYYQVLNKWSINLLWNVDNYKVTLYSKALKINFHTTCYKNSCNLVDISPIDYDIIIKKDWYDDYNLSFTLKNKEQKLINFYLNKTIKLQKILSNKDVDNIINDGDFFWKYYKYFPIEWNLYFFNESDLDNLDLYQKKGNKITKLYNFLKIEKEKIYIDKVYWNNDYLYIKYDNVDYIYDLKKFKIFNFKKSYDINYVKYDNQKFIFVLKNWLFTTDLELNNINNIWLFKDFIYLENNKLLFFINWDDVDNLKKYKVDSYLAILEYDLNSKKTKIVYNKSFDNVKKIYKENGKIILNTSNNQYELLNF